MIKIIVPVNQADEATIQRFWEMITKEYGETGYVKRDHAAHTTELYACFENEWNAIQFSLRLREEKYETRIIEKKETL
jgi:hypothetical protein